jgi:glycosyltransferase involved in cell wall biosynthesis
MESFGLAALEGMACFVPSIATRVGGIPELIEHDENGLLFEVGDVAGMSDAGVELLSEAGRLEEMAAEARRTAQAKFCASRIIPHYERFYHSMIHASSQRSAG